MQASMDITRALHDESEPSHCRAVNTPSPPPPKRGRETEREKERGRDEDKDHHGENKMGMSGMEKQRQTLGPEAEI